MVSLCRHCARCRACRPRGLCWSCYYTPGVKEQYPSTSKYARRGVGNAGFGYVLPPPDHSLEPGSEEKLRAMETRALAGVSLFHPAEPKIVNEVVVHRPECYRFPFHGQPQLGGDDMTFTHFENAGGGDYDDGSFGGGVPRRSLA